VSWRYHWTDRRRVTDSQQGLSAAHSHRDLVMCSDERYVNGDRAGWVTAPGTMLAVMGWER
jgi:hypothetical protein